jgi:hypothetical protein
MAAAPLSKINVHICNSVSVIPVLQEQNIMGCILQTTSKTPLQHTDEKVQEE